MRCVQGRLAMRTLVVAVQGALAAFAVFPAVAGDPAAAVLVTTVPDNSIELGPIYVDEDSAKFGEFNGLDRRGWYLDGNFNLKGGDGNADPFRWKLYGTNLGLDTRNIQGEVGAQGRWRVTGGYDEIVRNFSDTYMTLWDGAGGNALTLPGGYPAASARGNSPALANWNNIQAPNLNGTTTGGGPGYVIPANMHEFDLGTHRRIGNVAVSLPFAPGWEFTASARREVKDGTKITGVNMGRFTGVSALLPEPIDSTTDQFTAGVAFADKKWNFSASYYGSFYRNDVKTWTVEYPGQGGLLLGNVARMQSYPDNDMHQFNVGGGYRFTETTRLQVTGSWSEMTQNAAFIDPLAGSGWTYGDASAHAKVNNTYLYARLTSQPMQKLRVNASYRYDDRDNKTPIETFRVTTGDLAGAANLLTFENEPINRRAQTFNLDGEYSLGPGQAVRAEYERQDIRRTSTAEESPFRAEDTYEDTFRIEYRRNLSDTVAGRFSYAYSDRRRSDYEASPGIAPVAPAEGLAPGFEHFFLSERNRDKLRSQLNWQASDAVGLQATLDYNRDKYKPELGLREMRSWLFGLDGSLQANDRLAFNAYYSYEDGRHELDAFAIPRASSTATIVPHTPDGSCASYSNRAGTIPADVAVDPCRFWSEVQADKVHTVGLGAVYRGLMSGRLDVSGELSYSYSKSPIAVTGGTYYSNGVANSATGNVYVPATNLPDITTKLTQLRLVGTYSIDKQSTIRMQYIYGKLSSSDWAYDAYANSLLGVVAVTNYIGPGTTSPNYDVNVVSVSYIYQFR